MELERSRVASPSTCPPNMYFLHLVRNSHKSEGSGSSNKDDEYKTSTYKEEHSRKDIDLPLNYILSPTILKNTPISENMRAVKILLVSVSAVF